MPGDFGYDYFGFKTLEKSYLLRVHGKSVERPQHLIMRAACGIHCGDLAATLETYDLMSRKFFTHATPTLFNSGTPKPQMSSCFLLKMQEDSIEGIYDTLKQCALISKSVAGHESHFFPFSCNVSPYSFNDHVLIPWFTMVQTDTHIQHLSNFYSICFFSFSFKTFFFSKHFVVKPMFFLASNPWFHPQRPVALVWPSPTSAPAAPTSEAPMATAMAWCPCCGTSTKRPGMWTRAEANARDPLPCDFEEI